MPALHLSNLKALDLQRLDHVPQTGMVDAKSRSCLSHGIAAVAAANTNTMVADDHFKVASICRFMLVIMHAATSSRSYLPVPKNFLIES